MTVPTHDSVSDLTIAIFSFNGYQDLLADCLRSIRVHGPAAKELLVVWDDFVRERPVDFDAIRQESGTQFRVIMQSEIADWPTAIGRWGWIKQQLAKLACYRYTHTRYTWIVDGDVLLQGDPELWHKDGRPYLRYHEKPTGAGYVSFIKRYLDLYDIYPHDFVGSTCVFDSVECQRIEDHVRLKQGMSLADCVDHCITQPDHDPWPFSEFETYGTWIMNTCPHSHVLAPRNWNYAGQERNHHWPIQIGRKQKERI